MKRVIIQYRVTGKSHGYNKHYVADVIERQDGFFEARLFSTSKAKTTYATNYGVTQRYTHSGDERWAGGWEVPFETEAAAKDHLEQYLASRTWVKISKCRKLKEIR